ncbi:MAG TPA: uroporphyrinogen decarboxylase family protein [Armatimonadota bacterium]|jgi:uroporphyrinogen decarboxylase
MFTPNFDNLLAVLRHEAPSRPTLFEFILNGPLRTQLAGEDPTQEDAWLGDYRQRIMAYQAAGYDFAVVGGSSFGFPAGEARHDKSRSMNEGNVISDRESFAAYAWQDPEAHDYGRLRDIAPYLPEGMKLIVCCPGGVLENVMSLVGYERICYMIIDEPDFAREIFDAVGSRLLRYFELSVQYETVGAIISNDDWGFNSQTMLPPELMREYVFPWHKRIVAAAHAVGKPAILHSCGNLELVMEDIIEDMRFDGKHSYEDKICPVEEAYDRWGSRLAILGGLDLDFVCRSTPAEVHTRARAMLDRSALKGSYGLGTGNSVPEYVPTENYFAMITAATDQW